MSKLGIDFGSSYTTISWINPLSGKPEAVKFNGDGSVKCPSVILGLSHGLMFGYNAYLYLEEANKLPPNERIEILSNFIPSIKRVLDPEMSEYLSGKRYTHKQLLCEYFKYIGKLVHEHCGVEYGFDDVIFSHPVNFEQNKIELIRDSLLEAGFHVTGQKHEPLSAIDGFSLDHQINEDECVMVFDFGGGTIDVAVVQKKFGKLHTVCEPQGNSACGGNDIDYILYENVRKNIKAEYSFDISNNGMVDLGILYSCRRLKEYFSDSLDCHDTSILLVNDGRIINHKYKLSRQSFNNLISPKINEAIHVAELAVQNAQDKDYNIDKILLIGGSSRIQLVRELLQELCPKSIVETCGDKDIVVALGNISVQVCSNSYENEIVQDSPIIEDNTDVYELQGLIDRNKFIKCKHCGSMQCYKIIGKSGYHCLDCHQNSKNITITF